MINGISGRVSNWERAWKIPFEWVVLVVVLVLLVLVRVQPLWSIKRIS